MKLEKLKDPKNYFYLFIILSPFLDLASSLVRFSNISLSTIIRPLIPLILLIILFLKNKKIRHILLIVSPIYIIYCILHIYYYKHLLTPFSYGTITHEATYLCNYTYLIFTLFLTICLFYKEDTTKLKKSLLIYIAIYIVSIYLAIITKTSYPTYEEGIGYRGWFNTGGAVGSIFVLSLCILLPFLKTKRKKSYLLLIISILIYLIFLLGSRTGLIGGILVIIVYIIIEGIYQIKVKMKITKKQIGVILSLITIIITTIVLFGSTSLTRRAHLKELDGKIPDGSSDETIYMAYDFVKLKTSLDKNELSNTYMSKEQKQALLNLDKYTKLHKMRSTDLRSQQLIYHTFLYKEQTSIPLKLVGNGYLTNMGALTLEMELIALFYNFGIIGFILYFGPFLTILIYSLYKGIKNRRNIDIEYIMLLFGCLLSYALSLFAGHTYFNAAVMIIIILLHVLLLNKNYKEE